MSVVVGGCRWLDLVWLLVVVFSLVVGGYVECGCWWLC